MKPRHKPFAIAAIISFFAGLSFSFYKVHFPAQERSHWPTLTILVRDNAVPQDVIESFQAEFKANVQTINYKTKNELQAHLLDPRTTVDVVSLYCRDLEEFISGRKLKRIDSDLIPNRRNISPDFQGGKFDSGGLYSAAISWGVYGFIYDETKTGSELKSWKDLFQPKLKKKISMINDPNEFVNSLARKEILSLDALRALQIEVLKKKAKALSDQVVMGTETDLEKLKTGELWVSQVSNGNAAALLNESPNMKYFVPEEGATIWIQSLAIPKQSKNVELAHEFINYTLNQDVASATAEALKESSVNVTLDKSNIPLYLKPSFIKKLKISRLMFVPNLDESFVQMSSIIAPQIEIKDN